MPDIPATLTKVCICIFVYLCICVFVYLCICVFVYLCICNCVFAFVFDHHYLLFWFIFDENPFLRLSLALHEYLATEQGACT